MENKPFHKYRSVWEHAELMERLRRIRHLRETAANTPDND